MYYLTKTVQILYNYPRGGTYLFSFNKGVLPGLKAEGQIIDSEGSIRTLHRNKRKLVKICFTSIVRKVEAA